MQLRSLATALLALALSLTASAQTRLNLTDEQVRRIADSLEKTKEVKVFYHWCKDEKGDKRGLRWVTQGRLDRGEVDFFNRPTGDRQAYGAGIYLAESPTSSKSFGNFPVAAEVPAGTPIYDRATVKAIVGQDLTNEEITELGKRIPFIRKVSGDWWITHHPEPLSRLRYAGKYGVPVTDVNPRVFYQGVLDELVKKDPGNGYVESLSHLATYQDAISFVRSTRVRPDNPWHEFEPVEFEAYRRTMQQILRPNYNPDWENNFHIAPSAKLGQGRTPEAWSEWMITQVLPGLYSTLGGNSDGFRPNGVRAGGDSEGKTFRATPAQLGVLRSNPYLEVHATPAPDGENFLVSYEYPSVTNFRKLKDRIPADLFARLEAAERAPLGTAASRPALNRELVKALLQELFVRYHGKPYDDPAFLQEFISVHPYPDHNGRLSRTVLARAAVENGRSPPSLAISDLDLLLPPKLLEQALKAGTEAQNQIMHRLMAEMFEAKAEGRMPRYFDLPLDQFTFQGLAPLPPAPEVRLTPASYEDIRKRDWPAFLNMVKGKGWENQDPSLTLLALTEVDQLGAAGVTRREEIFSGVLKRIEGWLTRTSDPDGNGKWIFSETYLKLYDRLKPSERTRLDGMVVESLKLAKQDQIGEVLADPRVLERPGSMELIRLMAANPHAVQIYSNELLGPFTHYNHPRFGEWLMPAIEAGGNNAIIARSLSIPLLAQRADAPQLLGAILAKKSHGTHEALKTLRTPEWAQKPEAAGLMYRIINAGVGDARVVETLTSPDWIDRPETLKLARHLALRGKLEPSGAELLLKQPRFRADPEIIRGIGQYPANDLHLAEKFLRDPVSNSTVGRAVVEMLKKRAKPGQTQAQLALALLQSHWIDQPGNFEHALKLVASNKEASENILFLLNKTPLGGTPRGEEIVRAAIEVAPVDSIFREINSTTWKVTGARDRLFKTLLANPKTAAETVAHISCSNAIQDAEKNEIAKWMIENRLAPESLARWAGSSDNIPALREWVFENYRDPRLQTELEALAASRKWIRDPEFGRVISHIARTGDPSRIAKHMRLAFTDWNRREDRARILRRLLSRAPGDGEIIGLAFENGFTPPEQTADFFRIMAGGDPERVLRMLESSTYSRKPQGLALLETAIQRGLLEPVQASHADVEFILSYWQAQPRLIELCGGRGLRIRYQCLKDAVKRGERLYVEDTPQARRRGARIAACVRSYFAQ